MATSGEYTISEIGKIVIVPVKMAKVKDSVIEGIEPMRIALRESRVCVFTPNFFPHSDSRKSYFRRKMEFPNLSRY